MNKNIISFIIVIFFILTTISYYLCTHYARENFTHALQATPQNAHLWLISNHENMPLLALHTQQRYAENYLQHYFSPWSDNFSRYFPNLIAPIHHLKQIRQIEQNKADHFLQHPGYGINRLPNAQTWIKKIIDNMNLINFPNADIKVINIHSINLRELPTQQPIFGYWHAAGEGYPFDYLQDSVIAPNTPGRIMQKSKDGLWSFIVINNSYGWVPTYKLATVNTQFIAEWKKQHYVVLIKNNVPIIDDHEVLRFAANMGKIFPRIRLTQENDPIKNYSVLIAVADANQNAVIKIGYLHANVAATWPVIATPRHIANLLNTLLHIKYGWGGLSNDSDCSFTTMHLFSTLGIWLPRDSAQQIMAGKIISLNNLSNKEKEKIILQFGVPFLTLLHLPGHIVLYIGMKKNRISIFQTIWGLHTQFLWTKGRAILGDTVIAPVDLGKNYWNVSRTILDKIDSMIIFT